MCVHPRVYKKTKETNNENHDFGDYLDHNMIKKKKDMAQNRKPSSSFKAT